MRVKDAVGRFGEQVAADHLLRTGLLILARNWRCSAGELDIVAVDEFTLVFVEVKTRSSLAYGDPAEAVDRRKAARIRRLATRWMDEQRHVARAAVGSDGAAVPQPVPQPVPAWRAVRFDVVSVVRHRRGGVDVEHVLGAF